MGSAAAIAGQWIPASAGMTLILFGFPIGGGSDSPE